MSAWPTKLLKCLKFSSLILLKTLWRLTACPKWCNVSQILKCTSDAVFVFSGEHLLQLQTQHNHNQLMVTKNDKEKYHNQRYFLKWDAVRVFLLVEGLEARQSPLRGLISAAFLWEAGPRHERAQLLLSVSHRAPKLWEITNLLSNNKSSNPPIHVWIIQRQKTVAVSSQPITHFFQNIMETRADHDFIWHQCHL